MNNVNNVRCKNSRTFRKKEGIYEVTKLMSLKQTVETKILEAFTQA
jgi:hypothetical protein